MMNLMAYWRVSNLYIVYDVGNLYSDRSWKSNKLEGFLS